MDLGFSNNNVQTLDNIEVPDRYYERIKTGEPVIDRLFGGAEQPGLAPFASMLLTGEPGAGKSTFVMTIADALQRRAGKNVLYNAGEQNVYVVKMTAERMKLNAEFRVSQFGSVDDLIAYALENKVDVIIQDSLQTLTDGKLKGSNLIKSIGTKLATLADKQNVLVIAIGHITKSGQAAGPTLLKHMVDIHGHMFTTKTGDKFFEMKKNRFGPTGMRQRYFMNRYGISFASQQRTEVENLTLKDDRPKMREEPTVAREDTRGFFKRLWNRAGS